MEKRERLLAYLLLFALLAGDLWLYISFPYNPAFQLTLVVLGVIIYVLWGLWLHAVEDRLTEKVIGEYILLGLLVALLYYFQFLI